ncbi:MAG: cellulase family glycosylhydrolase [Planctomycetes bacterium]|nr:cellulase family glycosylhydrolase [Planctomycetota bacterium]
MKHLFPARSPHRAAALAALTLALAPLVSQTVPPRPPGWSTAEQIDAQCQNVRGLCYLAAFDGTYPDAPYGSPVAMWSILQVDCATAQPSPRFADVATQLGRLKQIGVNSIRVWLSYPLWKYYDDYPPAGCANNPVIDGLTEFLQVCDAAEMYVVPVLFDAVSTTSPADIVDPDNVYWSNPEEADKVINALRQGGWHSAPGEQVIQDIVAQLPTQPFAATSTGRYVSAVVGALKNENALLMWDLFNEPNIDDDPANATAQDYRVFIEQTAQLIRSVYGTGSYHHPLTVGSIDYSNVPGAPDKLVADAIDVLGVHIYTQHREGAAGLTANTSHPGKPILCTETGAGGWGQAYEDAINMCDHCPRPDLGAGSAAGLGFMIWGAMLHTTTPFAISDGVFYVDGEVRSAAACGAFIRAALRDGVTTGLLEPAEKQYPAPGSAGDGIFQLDVYSGAGTYGNQVARMQETVPGTVPHAELAYWYWWMVETRAMLFWMQFAWAGGRAHYQDFGFLDNWATQRAPGAFPRSWDPLLLQPATAGTTETGYLYEILLGHLLGEPVLGDLLNAAPGSPPYVASKTALERNLALIEDLMDIHTNASTGHLAPAHNYLVPDGSVNHGPYVTWNENLVANPRALYFRDSFYKIIHGQPLPAAPAQILDGPVGKAVYGWIYEPDRTATSDVLTAQLYSRNPNVAGNATTGDYYFGRNTGQAFTATQTVYLTDLRNPTLPASAKVVVAGFFWRDVGLRVKAIDALGNVLSTTSVAQGPAVTAPTPAMAQSTANLANAVRLDIELVFGPGTPGLGGADVLWVHIAPF